MVKESEMLNAWLWAEHREDLQWRRVRLGPYPTNEMGKMYMTMLRWADAIVIKEGIVYIIEAKLRPMPGAISQLELYKQLFTATLEFKQYWNNDVKLILLTMMPDLAIAEMCSRKDIAMIIFDWDDYVHVREQMLKPIFEERPLFL